MSLPFKVLTAFSPCSSRAKVIKPKPLQHNSIRNCFSLGGNNSLCDKLTEIAWWQDHEQLQYEQSHQMEKIFLLKALQLFQMIN